MPSTILEDRYEVIRPVGTGTHGQVFEAIDQITGERVAMKHIRRTTAGSSGLCEYSSVLAVDHPCIVRCLDFHYLSTGDTCLVYEYIAGGTLREMMTEGTPVDNEVWQGVARDMLSALAELHANQIVHCDIKPENILCLPRLGSTTRYKLSDLGVARHFRQNTTDSLSNSAGSPAYMSPEGFYRQYYPSSDLYSLGVILFELAVGHRPFDGDVSSIARSHLFTPPPIDCIKDPLQRDFIRWLLNKEPSSRPQTANDALRCIEGLEPENPVLSCPPPPLPSLLPLSAYRFSHTFDLLTNAQRLLALTLPGNPALASVYDGHIELFDATSGRSLNRFLPGKAETLQIHTDQSLLVVQPGRLVIWDSDFRLPHPLLDVGRDCRTARLDISRTHVMWVEGDQAFMRTISAQGASIHSFDCPSSGLHPHLLVAEESSGASFIVIPGTPVPEAFWVDSNGNVIARKTLPGPVIECSNTIFPAVVCATPGTTQRTYLSLIIFGLPGEINLLTYDTRTRFHGFCEDGVVAGFPDGTIQFLSAGGSEHALGSSDDRQCTFLFAPRREFYITITDSKPIRRCNLFRLP